MCLKLIQAGAPVVVLPSGAASAQTKDRARFALTSRAFAAKAKDDELRSETQDAAYAITTLPDFRETDNPHLSTKRYIKIPVR
jgi:hypothetical protein